MGYRAGMQYQGTVVDGSHLIETQNGTLGFQVMLESEEGTTSFTIWLTDKNKERATKMFTEVLGVPAYKLGDKAFVEYELANVICGVAVKFGVEEETYKEKTRLKVSFIGKPGSNGDMSGAVTAFFSTGKKKAQSTAVTPENPITDSEIPF